MELQERLHDALNYIESHLDQRIDGRVLAQKALCSEFHFQRMFSFLTGVTLAEYIRRRRLTAAAFELQRTGDKIIDIALKYGYESPGAFARAFRGLHGASPSQVRQNGAPVVSYPPISFQITLKGCAKMEYRMEQIGFIPRFVGKRMTVEHSRAFTAIPELWAKAKEDGLLQTLVGLTWEDPKCTLEGLVGVVGETSDIRTETFGYFMGGRYDGPTPEGMEEIVLAPSLYAVFPCKEFSGAPELWGRLYSEWLPVSGYELADLPCVEHYLGPDADCAFEIWMPVSRPLSDRKEKPTGS